VSRIFYGAGAAVLAGIALVAADRRRTSTAAAGLLVAMVAGGVFFMRPDPRRPHVVFETQTFYGDITVTESYPVRYLLLDGIHQSLWNVQTRENAGVYIHALEYGALAARRNAPHGHDGRALVIGLGAGALPMILEQHYGMVADSVDINRAVVATAREYFGFATRGQTRVEDGRTFVRAGADASYDLVVLDTFNGDAIPYHLLTREFFAEVARLLRPSGVLAVNTVGLQHPGGRLSDDVRAVAATLGMAFRHRRVFGLLAPEEARREEGLENVVLFASRAPIDAGAASEWRPPAREVLEGLITQEVPHDRLEGGQILSDDFNPIDFLNAPTARVWRARLRELAS
jgi:spermidine synthase